MVKKNFNGEGNPEFQVWKSEGPLPESNTDRIPVSLSLEEHRVLKVLLDRDRTSKQVHGGLKSLLALSDADAEVLLALLKRV